MLKLFIFTFFALSFELYSNEYKQYGNLNEIINNLPKDYSVLDSAFGDINEDKIPDLILILKLNDEEINSNCIDNPSYRPILLYLGDKQKNFSLAAHNEKLVLCYDCGGFFGDPYNGINISNGTFTIDHYGGSAWRWTNNYTFKYSKKLQTWKLLKIVSYSYHASNPNKMKTIRKTQKNFGQILFEDANIYEE